MLLRRDSFHVIQTTAALMRARIGRETEGREFDVVIIGGGIIGAGIARDAAMRGFKVVLFERQDFACGTTSGSTRLIHGGLRYLEMLDLRLVRMDLRERETLLRIAPHLVRPLQFLLPFYRRSAFFRLKMRLGMMLYDVLSFDKSLPSRCHLTREEVVAKEPLLRPEGLQGASGFFDAQVSSPERLCFENILAARQNGAVVFNCAEVVGARRSGVRISGVRVRDVLDGSETEVLGRIVVNAAGPWVDRVARRLSAEWSPQIRTTKGIHIACPQVSNNAMALFSPVDGRLFFVIPWLHYSWIGTTDTDFAEDPSCCRATGREVQYLLDSARAYFPKVADGPVFFSNAGVRALVSQKGDESSISRMHRLVDGERSGVPGLITVLGGKLTGYRAIAEEVVDLIARRLNRPLSCLTAVTALPGAQRVSSLCEPSPYDRELLAHLESLYGSRAPQVLDLAHSDEGLRERLAPDCPDIVAQVVFAVREEACVHASDFVERRSLLGFAHDQGRRAFPRIISVMTSELGWSSARAAQEMEACEQRLKNARMFAEELERR